MAACMTHVSIKNCYLKPSNTKVVSLSENTFIDLMSLDIMSTGRTITKKVFQEMN